MIRRKPHGLHRKTPLTLRYPRSLLISALWAIAFTASGCSGFQSLEVSAGEPVNASLPGRITSMNLAAAQSPVQPSQSDSTARNCLSTESALRSTLASGSDAVLCPGAIIQLRQSLSFTKSGQKLYTLGFPEDATRATLMIDPASTGLTTVIDTEPIQQTTQFLDSIAIRNVIIDGNAKRLGVVTKCDFPDGCRGLVNLGAVTNPIVSHSEIRYSRTWSHLVLTNNFGGCRGGQITNNVIGPAVPTGVFAFTDGISLNCSDTTVAGNQIFDVTDVGVVVFSQPNVKVTGNTITAVRNHMNAGLTAVDYIQGHGNFSGTVFSENVINSTASQGGYIFIGIAAGNHTWFGTAYDNHQPKYNYGAFITNNLLNGPGIGVGIAVSGVNAFTITGNTLQATNMVVDPSHVTASNLQGGYSTVASGGLDSFVLRGFFVLRLYKNFLNVAAPDAAGLLFWTQALSSCSSKKALQVVRDFAGLSAAHLNALSPSDAANTLYKVILNRNGEPGGLSFWANTIAASATRTQGVQNAAAAFFRSQEYTQASNGMCPYSRNNEN